jgi:hypothetical protein
MLLIRLNDWDDDDDAYADTPIYDSYCTTEGCVKLRWCDLCETCRDHCSCFSLTPTDGAQQPEDKT